MKIPPYVHSLPPFFNFLKVAKRLSGLTYLYATDYKTAKDLLQKGWEES